MIEPGREDAAAAAGAIAAVATGGEAAGAAGGSAPAAEPTTLTEDQLAGLDLGGSASGAAPADLDVSLEECARFFDKSEPTVRKWIAAGCPVRERGGRGVAFKMSLRQVWDWLEAARQREAQLEERRQKAQAQLRLELFGGDGLEPAAGRGLTPREQAEELQAELARTKLAQLRGELVRADRMQAAITRTFRLLVDRLRAIPDQVAADLDLDKPAADRLLEGVDRALEDIVTLVANLDPEKVEAEAAAIEARGGVLL